MTIETLSWTALFSVLPISELRGAIPFAVSKGMNPFYAYFFCVFLNALVGPFVFLFLNTFHRLFNKLKWYRSLFDHIVIRTRKKMADKINKYGYLGVTLFVAIPFPITGAWTGTFGAWVFGLKKRKTIPAILLGVAISGLIVSIITYFGIEFLSFLVKKV